MSDSKDKKPSEIENVTEDQVVSSGRRKFTKASLLCSPVVLSAVSKPALALRCGVSGHMSGNLSDQSQHQVCRLGKSPGFWKNHPDQWISLTGIDPGIKPSTGIAPNGCNDCRSSGNWICTGGDMFNDIFTAGPSVAPNMSLHQVICQYPNEDTFHIIAALLNARAWPDYILTENEVKALWVDPTSGGQIPHGGFRSFLDQTWD